MRFNFLLSLPLFFTLTACGNALNCAINGDNLEGRVTFAQSVSITPGADVVVQFSSDSFAVDKTSSVIKNAHGLVAIPYSFCVPAGAYQVRAFQDLNYDGVPDSGEASGRLDGTSTGDAAFINQTITEDSNQSTTRITDADLVIDTP